jgi:hypothetical protein
LNDILFRKYIIEVVKIAETKGDIIDKIDTLETEIRREIGEIRRNAGIENVPKPRGKSPVIVTKLHTMLSGRYGYKNGLSIDQIAVSLYGQSSWVTRTRARQMLALIRKKFDLPIYSVRPIGISGKRKERYCILNDKFECKQVNEHLDKVKDGIKKSQRRVSKRENILTMKNRPKINKVMNNG